MKTIEKFDGFKFRQAKATTPVPNFRGEDWELEKEQVLKDAETSLERMWVHLYHKLAKKLASG